MRNKNYTQIGVTKEIRDKIKSLGRKGETYTDILKRVLKR